MKSIRGKVKLINAEVTIDKIKQERDTYRELCGELTNALHNHYWNDCTKHSRSIEALIYKAKSILGDSNAT